MSSTPLHGAPHMVSGETDLTCDFCRTHKKTLTQASQNTRRVGGASRDRNPGVEVGNDTPGTKDQQESFTVEMLVRLSLL